MTATRHIAGGLCAVMAAATLTAAALPAAAQPGDERDGTELRVHYSSSAHGPHAVRATSLDRRHGRLIERDRDGFGTSYTFTFPAAGADAYLGFTTDDDTFGDQTRYVRAADGEAEVWVLEDDPRTYTEPQEVASGDVTWRDGTPYVAVEDLAGLLDLTYSYGTNGYRFDGAAPGTLDILTIFRGRDYFEISTGTDRIGSNVTGNMLRAYTDLVFDDVDGFRADGKYYLSFGQIERTFQVAMRTGEGRSWLLVPEDVAYDTLQTADPEDVGFDADRLAELDQFLQSQVDDGSPAVAVIVTKDGKIVKNDAYGYALRYSTREVGGQTLPAELLPEEEWQEASTDTLFDLASNTKMYATNYAIQHLVSEGRLDLDQPVSSFPGWGCFTDESTVYTGKWTVGGAGGITAEHTGKADITLRDLLHHRGGLIPDPEYPNLTSAGELWYQTTDPDDRSGIISAICETPLMYAPRTTFAYSDVDFMILGLIVEQVTGQRLDSYLEQEFYAPLGLEHTYFNPLDHGIEPEQVAATELNGNTRDGNVSFGTQVDGTPVFIRDYTLRGEVHDEKAFYSMAGIAGHAGLFSTTSDMAVLTQLMLNDGIYEGEQYFTEDVIGEFTAPYSPDPDEVDSSTYGLGWRVHSASAAAYWYFNWGPSRSTFGHQGWTGTLTIIDPLHDMTITILTNMRHSPVIDPPNGFAGGQYPVSDLAPISAHVYRALTNETEQTATTAGLNSSLARYIESGGVAGPIAGQLDRTLDQAARHLENERTRPAAGALERFIRHLDHPKRPDTLSPQAATDLRAQASALLALLD